MKILHRRDPRDRSLDSLDPSQVSSILVVSTTGLGDTVLSTPAIHAVRRAFPRARIIGHVHQKFKDLMNHHPDLDGLIPYQGTYNRRYKGFWSTIRAFRREKIDLVFLFHANDPQAVPMAYLSGARWICRRPAVGRFDFLLSHPEGEEGYFSEHAAVGRIKTAAKVGCPTDDLTLRLSPKAADFPGLKKIFEGMGIPESSGPKTAFQVGASYPYKCWPPGHFVALGKALVARHPEMRIYLLGNRKEKRLCRTIQKGIENPRVVNLAGRLTVPMTMALLLDLDLLVTNDTGPLHLAIALGTKTVSFFGPTSPDLFGPLQDLDRHQVLYQPPECRPCLEKKCRRPDCLAAITVEQALSACETQLYGKK